MRAAIRYKVAEQSFDDTVMIMCVGCRCMLFVDNQRKSGRAYMG